MRQIVCPNCGYKIETGILDKPTACPKCGHVIDMDGVGGTYAS